MTYAEASPEQIARLEMRLEAIPVEMRREVRRQAARRRRLRYAAIEAAWVASLIMLTLAFVVTA